VCVVRNARTGFSGRFPGQANPSLKFSFISFVPGVFAAFGEDFNECLSGANQTQQRETPVTSKRNEMVVATSVDADRSLRHGTQVMTKHRSVRIKRVGHTEKNASSHSRRIGGPPLKIEQIR
jgi:hypothetical protein